MARAEPDAGAGGAGRLEQDGLVETEPQRFTRVAPLDRRAARDAFPIVAALHALAAELGVPRLTAADLEAMRDGQRALRRTRCSDDDVDAALARRRRLPRRVRCTRRANVELARALDRLMPRLRRLERLRFGSLAGRASVRQHDADHRRRGGPRRPDDRRARARELALARDLDRPELRMTAIAPPDIHDAETLAAARALLDAAADPRADAARGARRRRPQRAVARPRVHQPARARGADEPDRPAAALRRGRPARRRGPHRPGQPLVRGHASTSTRSRRCASSCSSACSRATTPSTGWSRA